MTSAQRRQRLNALGYGIARNVKDCMGRTHAFKTFPTRSSGPTNYFPDTTAVDRFIENVEKVRGWQEEVTAKQAACDHNEMVETGIKDFAWKCAKCGYVYGA